jgi:hypothetical protein
MSHRKILLTLVAIPIVALLVAILVAPLIWAIHYFGLYLGYGNYKVRGHQEFARNGVSQIKPAKEMNELFADCRHYITYGPNDVPLFNSVAYFGGRYTLTMQVEVDIHSASSGVIVGKPQFYLNEVALVTVSASGQVGATFSRSRNFGAAEWIQLFDADGDFSKIGFKVNPTAVTDFERYAAACRPSN